MTLTGNEFLLAAISVYLEDDRDLPEQWPFLVGEAKDLGFTGLTTDFQALLTEFADGGFH